MRNFRSRLGRFALFATMATALTLSAATPSFAQLTGSNFEGNDGNLIVNTSGNTDWANVANRTTGPDKPSGSSDDSFGQGAKEDAIAPTIVSGSIPPNKNDLTRFYVASEFVSNANYLYLAWERLVNIGAADIDFEINQNRCGAAPTFTNCSANHVTPTRKAGDLLVLYEFAGSGTPTIQISKWVTSGTPSLVCESSSTLPCWGKVMTLDASEAEAAVNTATVTDPLNGGASLTTGLFGETAINLTTAGVFPAGTCEAFGSAYTKARTSGSSFDSELKDFIAPQPVHISNCATIKITKVTQNGDHTFNYSTTGGLSPSTFQLSNGQSQTYSSVPSGTYSVTEGAEPAGWSFVSLNCTNSNANTSATTSGTTANISVTGAGEEDCTYTNHINLSPSISTLLSATNPVAIGTTVHDSATLTGATSNAGGTVTYTVYTDNACSLGAQDAGTKTVTNGVVPDSNPITFNSAGTFYWQAVYSGDANNNGATSACTSEQLVVNPNTPAMSTAQHLIPNDDATISGATSNAGGTITFKLFSPSDATCSGTPALTQTVNVNGNSTYSTSNTTFIASDAGTWRWLVSYSGDANNAGTTSSCGVEHFTITNS